MARVADSSGQKGHSRVALAFSQRLLSGYMVHALIGGLVCY